MSDTSVILIRGARQHNLKNINVDVPRGKLTVVTGRSGSGKSSLAFDTIHAEGQRRYVESLSAYARQFLEQLQKPDVDRIEGLSPTIAIEQRSGVSGPRSTVATCTEIYDYLRVLFARVGRPECWKCDRPITAQSISDMVDSVLAMPPRTKVMLLAPVVTQQPGSHRALLDSILKRGFIRARVDGAVGLLEEMRPLPPQKPHTIEAVVDRLVIKPEISGRLADSIAVALDLSRGSVIIAAQTEERWIDTRHSAVPACPDHPEVRVEALAPNLFGFHSPTGACSKCQGLGTLMEFDPELVLPDPRLSLAAGAIAPWRAAGRHGSAHRIAHRFADIIEAFCRDFGVLPDMGVRHFSADQRRILMTGTTKADACRFGASFDGVMPLLARQWATAPSDSLKARWQGFQSESPCPQCHGARLNRQALCVKLGGTNIHDVTAMTVAEARRFFDTLAIPEHLRPVAAPLMDAVIRRLGFMSDVGIDYLTLGRSTQTLSGGEWQRARLATQIGSGLAGVCYVLDEPTIGLHPRDSVRLAEILEQLARLDNTVIVVEHDDQVIARADYVIDVGPGAGTHGGEIVCAGPLKDVLTCGTSLTAGYLTGRLGIEVPDVRRRPDANRCVELLGVAANNLKSIDVRFPLGCLTCVTGVSGSGKSTLVNQVLWRELYRRRHSSGPRPGPFRKIINSDLIEKIIQVDQSAIGRSP
ncbi:MAG: excinuclease ABC subunit UvrA, partial [Phycisphaerae bacterium]